jgi:hypothetical protein
VAIENSEAVFELFEVCLLERCLADEAGEFCSWNSLFTRFTGIVEREK